MAKPRVKKVDKGLNRIKADFKKMDGAYAKVGVLADAGTYKEESVNIALVAAVLHYGRDGSYKKWPFIANGIKKGTSQLNRLREKVLLKITKNEFSVRQGISLIGLKGEALIKKEIRTVTSPAIEDSTAARKKGSTKPLIDSGQLLNSISHEVEL